MKHLKYQKCNNKNTRVLKVKNSPLKLEKCYKPIIISMSNMDKFEKKGIKKGHLQKTCYMIGTIAELTILLSLQKKP